MEKQMSLTSKIKRELWVVYATIAALEMVFCGGIIALLPLALALVYRKKKFCVLACVIPILLVLVLALGIAGNIHDLPFIAVM